MEERDVKQAAHNNWSFSELNKSYCVSVSTRVFACFLYTAYLFELEPPMVVNWLPILAFSYTRKALYQ